MRIHTSPPETISSHKGHEPTIHRNNACLIITWEMFKLINNQPQIHLKETISQSPIKLAKV